MSDQSKFTLLKWVHFALGTLVGMLLLGLILWLLHSQHVIEQKSASEDPYFRQVKATLHSLETWNSLSSEKQTDALETGFTPYIRTVISALRENQVGLIKDKQRPLSDISAIHIAKRSRRIYFAGSQFKDLLKPGWSKHLFLGLHHGGRVFQRKITHFYPRSIGLEDFRSYRDSFQIFRSKERYLAWYLGFMGEYTFVILVDFDRLTGTRLTNLISRIISSETLGSEQDQTQGPWNLARSNWYWTLLALLAWGWICNRGWTLYLGGRFSFRLILIFLLFLVLLDGMLISLFREMRLNKEVQVRENLESRWRLSMQKVEKGFDPFLQQIASGLSKTLKSGKELDESSIPDFLILFATDRQARTQTYNGKLDPMTHDLMLLSTAQLIPTVADAQIHDVKALQKRFFQKKATQVEFRKKLIDKVSEELVRFGKGAFHHIEILSSGLYLLWEHSGVGESFRIYAARGRKKNTLKAYFETLARSKLEGINSEMVRAILQDGTILDIGAAGESKAQYPTDILHKLKSTPNQFQILRWRGKSFFALQTSSKSLGGFDLLYLLPESKALAAISLMDSRFFWFQALTLLLALVSCSLLLRMVQNPLGLLNEGFQRAQKEDLEFDLQAAGRNEISSVLRGFNSMLTELKRRKKLLPFIPHEILKLFKKDSGGYESRISDEAVVVFSDIRSFTSISETYEPEEIVSMLNEYFSIWQRRVGKYSGVIEKFIGDAVVVVFFKQNSHSFMQEAVQTSIEVMSELQEFNAARKEAGKFTIQNGIGICSGTVSLGILGTERKRHFHARGKAVERAEELEAESKNGRFTRILTDKTVYEAVRFQYDLEPHQDRSEAEPIFELSSL